MRRALYQRQGHGGAHQKKVIVKMTRIALRFLAYTLAGILFGGAGFMALSSVLAAAGLAPITAIAGTALVLYLLSNASRVPGQGIRITPARSLVAMDIVCVVAAALTGFFIFQGYASSFGGTVFLPGDPLAADVMLFMFFPSVLVLSAVVSTTGAQRIQIDATGLVLSGKMGGNVAWDTIKAFQPDQQYVIVSRVGLPMPKHLRTNLEVVLSNGENLKIYEPGLKSTRRKILEKLRQFSPLRLSTDIDVIAANWR